MKRKLKHFIDLLFHVIDRTRITFGKNLFFSFRLFTLFATSFLLGILVASIISFNWERSWPVFLLSVIALLSVALFNFTYKAKYLTLIAFGFIFVIVGLAYYSLFESIHIVRLDFDKKVEAQGKVAARPERDHKQQKVVLLIKDLPSEQNVKVLALLPPFPEYRYGDTLLVAGQIKEPKNFGDFDYKSYLKRYLIFGTIQTDETKLISSNKSFGEKMLFWLYFSAEKFENTLNRIIAEPQASLASGILLGVKRNIPDDLMDWLNRAGLTHIIALSGYNVTIIVAMLSAALAASIGRNRTFWLGTLLVIGFVLLTGASASVIRAAIFSLLILFGKTLGRQGDQTNLMLLAALLMVLFNPYVLRWDIGFQLSFLAFCGLIYLSPSLHRLFEKSKARYLPEMIKSPLAETLSAQIFVLPILMFQFGRISLIAPLSNILVLWTMPYAMAATSVAGILGLIYYPLGKIAGFLLWPAMEYIIKVTEIMAKIPFSSFQIK